MTNKLIIDPLYSCIVLKPPQVSPHSEEFLQKNLLYDRFNVITYEEPVKQLVQSVLDAY